MIDRDFAKSRIKTPSASYLAGRPAFSQYMKVKENPWSEIKKDVRDTHYYFIKYPSGAVLVTQ